MKTRMLVFPNGYDPLLADCENVQELHKRGITDRNEVDIARAKELKAKAEIVEIEEGEQLPEQYRYRWHTKLPN